ncbi:hypothetical protein KR222_008554, partial [Zaprionus bogoriensis]
FIFKAMEIASENPQAATRLEDTALRHKIREYARQQRKGLRTNTTDALRFGLGQIQDEIRELENLGIKDVHGLASRIKRRKHATAEDMYRLSHAFLQGNDNINAFAQVQGALQVLVKELTGAHVDRQIEAAECLCNFSLGESHVCEKITTLAGSYLVTYLNSQEARLKRSCLWTLANILATCAKSGKTLLQMQLVTKLWKLYTAPASDVHGFQQDAGVCLYLIALQAASLIPVEDCRYVAQHLHELQPTAAGAEYYMYLVFQFDLLALERQLCAPHFQHLYAFFLGNLHEDFATPAGQLRLLYSVRVLSNLFAIRPTSAELQLAAAPLTAALNQLFALRDAALTRELLQLLRNLLELQLLDSEQLLEQLQVYD